MIKNFLKAILFKKSQSYIKYQYTQFSDKRSSDTCAKVFLRPQISFVVIKYLILFQILYPLWTETNFYGGLLYTVRMTGHDPCLQGGEECRKRRAAIAGQQVFMDRLIRLVKMVARESGNRKKKVIALIFIVIKIF